MATIKDSRMIVEEPGYTVKIKTLPDFFNFHRGVNTMDSILLNSMKKKK